MCIRDDSYVSEGASITIEEVSIGSGDDRITYYVANVVLSDATSLQSAFAKDNGAVFAINGDYYGFRDTGIVIRNGIAYRDEGAEPVSPSTETLSLIHI